jgi:hypothetical protein
MLKKFQGNCTMLFTNVYVISMNPYWALFCARGRNLAEENISQVELASSVLPLSQASVFGWWKHGNYLLLLWSGPCSITKIEAKEGQLKAEMRKVLLGWGEEIWPSKSGRLLFEILGRAWTSLRNCNQCLAGNLCGQESEPRCLLVGLVWAGRVRGRESWVEGGMLWADVVQVLMARLPPPAWWSKMEKFSGLL